MRSGRAHDRRAARRLHRRAGPGPRRERRASTQETLGSARGTRTRPRPGSSSRRETSRSPSSSRPTPGCELFVPLPFGSIVIRVPDVEAARAKLEDAGVEVVGETWDSGVCNGAVFTDPEGNGTGCSITATSRTRTGRRRDRRRARRLHPGAGDGHGRRPTTSTVSCWASSGTRTRPTTTGSSTRRATSRSRS